MYYKLKEDHMAKQTKKSTSTRSSSGIWGLNKISFWLIVAATILYAVALILSACGVSSIAVSALQGIAAAAMIIIVAILAWRYVRPKPAVWKVLYFVCLLIIIAGIIVPLVIG